MKNLAFVIILLLVFSSCKMFKTITVDEDNFAWKSYKDSELDQSVNLNEYKSPNERDGQNKDKLVILCASGGGSRAAAFNIGILLELEKILSEPNANSIDSNRNILNEIDYFSTVSGGGWGVSSFIAYKHQKQKYSQKLYVDGIQAYNNQESDPHKKIEFFPTYNSYEKYLANRADFRYYKYQIPLILTLWFGSVKSDKYMTNRLNAGYLGWSYRNKVERKIWVSVHPGDTYNSNKVDEIVLGDIFKPIDTKEPLIPMLITNTTNIDNYKLVPFTPDRLRFWGVINYRHYVNNIQTLPIIGNTTNYNSIPLASGIKASSGIPFAVSSSSFKALKKYNPQSPLGVDYYLHLQDGGIIDQQAIHTAKAILNHHDKIDKKENRIVFVVDASSTGVENKSKFRKRKAGRLYNLWRVVAPFSTPDAQYALTRERVKLLQKEYNCKVIYLGTEVLLDTTLNAIKITEDLPRHKKKVEDYFYNKYDSVKNDTIGFLKFSTDQRKLLFAYITNISTWFASKGSKFDGKYIEDDPKSTAKIMFLAGRGVVQLKRQEIMNAFK